MGSMPPEKRRALDEFLSGPCVYLNKKLICTIGIHRAAFITSLVDRYCQARDSEKLIDGMVYYPMAQQWYDTALPYRRIQRAKRYFQKRGMLRIREGDALGEEYYSVDLDAVSALIDGESILPEHELEQSNENIQPKQAANA